MSDLFETLDVDCSGVISRGLETVHVERGVLTINIRHWTCFETCFLVVSEGFESHHFVRVCHELGGQSRSFLVIAFHKAMNLSKVFCFLAVLMRKIPECKL